MVYKRIFLARVFTIEKKRNHLLVHFRDTHMKYNGKMMRLLKRMILICTYLETSVCYCLGGKNKIVKQYEESGFIYVGKMKTKGECM